MKTDQHPNPETPAGLHGELTALWVPPGPEAHMLAQRWDEYLKMTSYSDPNWVGVLGRMERLSIVGQRFLKPVPPSELSGPITLRPEPLNPFDSNAIAAFYGDVMIGHIRKVQTPTLHQRWLHINREGGPVFASTSDPTSVYLFDL